MTNRFNTGLKTLTGLAVLLLLGLLFNSVFRQLQEYSQQNNFVPGSASSSNLIAFTSEKSGDPEIYTMYADGSNVINLTNNPANDTSPAWSPDGTRLAFISDRLGRPQIFVMNADGSNVVQLTDIPDTAGWWDPLDWSPNGQWLVASRIPSKMAWVDKGQVNLYLINADGSGATQITTNEVGNDYDPLWSPDGEIIAFTRFTYGPTKIYSVNPDGTNLAILASSAGNDSPFVWAPDGARLIYFSSDRYCNKNCPPPIELRSVRANGSNQATLLTLTNHSFCSAERLTWSPDGTRLLISSLDCEGRGLIYVINADGTGLKQLMDSKAIISFTPGQVPRPDWSPDDKFITFDSDRAGSLDIYILNIDDALMNPAIGPIRLTDDPGGDYSPVWQPKP